MSHLTSADIEEIKEVLAVIVPVFGQLINKAVLEALRQHSSEQAVQVSGPGLDISTIRQDIAKTVKHLQKTDVKKLVEGRSKPTDKEMLALVGEFDASKWAEMFLRVQPRLDLDTMRGWFANAIMAGHDHVKKEERKKIKSMQDCLNIQGSQGNWDADYYMHGMFNGMEHMMAIAEDREPQFRSWPKDKDDISAKQGCTDKIEAPGERVVWAQTFAAVYGQKQNWAFCNTDQQVPAAAQIADEAVKAFRTRYK